MNYKFCIIVTVCILFLNVMPFYTNNADGDIRTEIAGIKDQIVSLKERITESNRDILQQKDTIKYNEERLVLLKQIEKEKRNNTGKSWTGQQELERARTDVRNAETALQNSKDRLQSLYITRNDYFSSLKTLEEQLQELEKQPAPKVSVNGIIGITIDNNCRILIKNNITTDCPTFEAINQLYPGSPCSFSEEGCVKYYRQMGGFHYIIDPPAAVMERIKMVEIRSNFEEFHIQDSGGYSNYTLNYQTGRYLDGCKTAYIGTDNWIGFTGDSINLLYHNCDESFSYLGGYRYEHLNRTVHDITSSYKWQLEQWIKESKEKCLEKCFEY